MGEAYTLITPSLQEKKKKTLRQNICKILCLNITVLDTFFLYLEERGFLGRSSCKTELHFAKHIIQQENQLSRTQHNLLSHLKHARILEEIYNFLRMDVCGV